MWGRSQPTTVAAASVGQLTLTDAAGPEPSSSLDTSTCAAASSGQPRTALMFSPTHPEGPSEPPAPPAPKRRGRPRKAQAPVEQTTTALVLSPTRSEHSGTAAPVEQPPPGPHPMPLGATNSAAPAEQGPTTTLVAAPVTVVATASGNDDLEVGDYVTISPEAAFSNEPQPFL